MNITGAVGSAEYAHARLRARLGARPDEAAWHPLEITRDLAPLLERARAGALARWVQGLPASAGPHQIEQALRLRWREQVAELAGWMDGPWQPAIRWCALLVDLPVLAQWARGEALPAWVAADELLGALLSRDKRAHDAAAGARVAAPQQLAALRDAARATPADVLGAWLQLWRRLLPVNRASTTLERTLVPLLSAHARRFAAPGAADGWALRRALGVQLLALLRRHPAEPIEVFLFLALQALELERLRAELVGRAAFPRRTLHA